MVNTAIHFTGEEGFRRNNFRKNSIIPNAFEI